jgi:hypothetical protein
MGKALVAIRCLTRRDASFPSDVALGYQPQPRSEMSLGETPANRN